MPRKYSDPVYVHDIPWWFYDTLIVAGCAFFLWLSVRLTPAALVPLVVLIYGSLIEPRRLAVRRIPIGEGKREVRIAFLSDVHVGPYKGAAWVRRLVRKTHALKPDLVLLGGDFLYRNASALKDLEPFRDLKAPLGTFAILGNHDEWRAHQESIDWFRRSGIPLLINRSVRVMKDGSGLAVAGADDDWYGETDLAATFRDARADEPILAMLHNPDLVPPAAALLKGRRAPTVLFSGHAHGGQIRLPLIGPVPRLPHHLGRKYDRGLFDFDGIALVIGQGVGESGPRARLFCPPEIALVTLRF